MREISFDARQRFRQRMLNIEFADEILNYLSKFVDGYIHIEGTTTNDQYNTIYVLPIEAAKIEKTIGTTQRNMSIDCYTQKSEWTTER